VHHASSWAALAPLGWDDRRAAELAALERPDAVPARVVRVDRGSALVLGPDGPARAAGDGLATGDWLALERGAVSVLPRRSAIRRRAPGRADEEQVLAANVDAVLLVHGLDRPVPPRRVHRALATVWEAGAIPILVLTKADLAAAPEREAQAIASDAPGVEIHLVDALDGRGVDALAAYARPAGTVALLGESGAGKSTLANRLLGRDTVATGPVREGDAKGRHTTTARHLLPLPGGGALIDTPGLRELGLWGAERGVARTFSDIDELARRCRFRDCRHAGEPGCAVRAAVEAGSLDPERLRSLEDLRRELAALERRRDERVARAHGRRGARMAREAIAAKRRRR